MLEQAPILKEMLTGYRATCYGYYRGNNGGNNSNAAAVAAHADGTEVLFAGSKETPLMSVAGDANAAAFCSSMSLI